MVRVLVISTRGLFGQGIVALLGRESGLELVGHVDNAERAILEIERLRPEAVVIVQEGCDERSAAGLAACALGAGAKRVIGLSLADDILYLFPGGACVAGGPEDLFRAIRGDPGLDARIDGKPTDLSLPGT